MYNILEITFASWLKIFKLLDAAYLMPPAGPAPKAHLLLNSMDLSSVEQFTWTPSDFRCCNSRGGKKLKNYYDNSVAQNLERYDNVSEESYERKWDVNVHVKLEHLMLSKQTMVVAYVRTMVVAYVRTYNLHPGLLRSESSKMEDSDFLSGKSQWLRDLKSLKVVSV